MECRNFFIAISLFPVIMSHRDYTNNELEVGLEIFKELNIGHCVIVVENVRSIIFDHKKIYNHNKFIAHIQKEQLKLFLNNAQSFFMRIGFVINIDVISALETLFQKNPLKVSRFTWLVLTNENIGHKLNIPYNCEFLTVGLGKDDEYVIKEIYHVKYSGPFVVDFGIWSKASGLIRNDKFYDERKDMKGVRIVSGEKKGYKPCHDFPIEIKHREMWVEYGRLLNYSLVVVNDDLYNKATDPMAPDGSPCTIAQHALYYIPDTVFPTCLMPTNIIIKFENDRGEGWKAFVKPFDDRLWYFIFGFIVLVIVTFMIIGYFTSTVFYMNPFAAFYSFCSQDGIDLNNERFTNLSSLIAYLMPFIAAAFIVPVYSAVISAQLTVQLPRIPFTDLETFVRDGNYKLGALNNTFSLAYFSRSKDPLVRHIYQKMFINKDEYPNINEEAIDILCNEKNFAFVAYGGLQFLGKKTYCQLFKIQNFVINLYCGFRMRIGSPFRNIFSKQLTKYYTTGLIQRIDFYILTRTNIKEHEMEPIEFLQILPIIYLVSLGIFLSIISLVIEIYIRKIKKLITDVFKRKRNKGDDVHLVKL